MTSGLIVVTTLVNLMIMQPDDNRGARPDRPYRGLEGLPGTPSTSLKPAASAGTNVGEAATPEARGANGGAATDPADVLTAAVQSELARRGYVPGTQGHLDMVTRAAIMAFEHDRGLALSAEPSLQLLAELKSDVPLTVPGAASRAASEQAQSVIRTVQQSLARLNYQPGVPDGVMGQATASAIRAFERDQRLPESGRVSGLLVTRLAAVSQDRLAQR